MVEDNVCAKCRKCCQNPAYIPLLTQDEVDIIEKKLNSKIEVELFNDENGVKVYNIVSGKCPAFDLEKPGCILDEKERPCHCLLFPFRPDFDEELKEWHLDLAITKCPGALSFAKHAEKAIALFNEMRKDGRWK